jgi:hypothetical protein
MGGNWPQLKIPGMIFDAVPHWPVGIGILMWWWRRRRLHCSKDPRLAPRISQVLVLEEAANMMKFEFQALDLLLNLSAARLWLCSSHLEWNQPLLHTLLGICHTVLNPLAATLDAVTELRLHLLELLEHELDSGINRILRPWAASVVEGVRLHGSTNLIPNVNTSGRRSRSNMGSREEAGEWSR